MRRRLEDCPATVTPLNQHAGKFFRRNQLKRKLQQPWDIYSRLPLLGHTAAQRERERERERKGNSEKLEFSNRRMKTCAE